MAPKSTFLALELFFTSCKIYIINQSFSLTGKFVFSGRNYKEILLKNKDCIVPFPPQYW